MKRKLLLCLLIISLYNVASYAGNNVTVRSGDILLFNQKGNATIKFDYSITEVNDYSLKDYIEEKGGNEYKDDWDSWIREGERLFVEDFNKKNSGMKFTRSTKTETEYKIIVKVKTMNTGNTAKGFLPTLSLKMKDGAPEMNGTLEVKDNNGKSVCVLTLKNIYGANSLNTSSRLATLYLALSKKIRKAIEKSVKESAKIAKKGNAEDEDVDEQEDEDSDEDSDEDGDEDGDEGDDEDNEDDDEE